MRSNTILIQFFIDNGLIREYAVYLMLKGIYTNATFYEWNYKNLSKTSGLSQSALRKHIKFFLNNKWCFIRNSQLSFVSHHKLTRLYKFNPTHKNNDCKIDKESKIQETIDNLRSQIIKNKFLQSFFIKEMKQNLIDPKGFGALGKFKRAKRYFKKHPDYLKPQKDVAELNLNDNPKNVIISYESIGKLVGISDSSAHILIKKMIYKGKIKKEKGKVIVTDLKGAKVSSDCLPSNGFIHKGFFFQQQCNQYQL